jgi:hypothetical protein
MGLFRLRIISGHLNLSVLWLVVRKRDWTKCSKYINNNTLIILISIVNIIGDLYDHFMSMEIFTLTMNEVFI